MEDELKGIGIEPDGAVSVDTAQAVQAGAGTVMGENAAGAAAEAQAAYAAVLDTGMKTGLLVLVIMFILYISGILPPYVPLKKLPGLWGMPVHKYLSVTGIHPGWAWTGMLGKGDFLNLTGIAFMASLTIVCYMRIIPIFIRKKEVLYSVISVLEVLILIFAASGILKTGVH